MRMNETNNKIKALNKTFSGLIDDFNKKTLYNAQKIDLGLHSNDSDIYYFLKTFILRRKSIAELYYFNIK